MHRVLKDFCQFYRELDARPLSELSSIYTDDIEFCDPVHCIKGMADFRRYFEDLMQKVTHCRFDIHEVNELEEQAFLSWTMHFQHPGLNRGEMISVDGLSHLRFGEKIYFHRDYFDLGAMLYEQIPLLGRLVRGVKSRLK